MFVLRSRVMWCSVVCFRFFFLFFFGKCRCVSFVCVMFVLRVLCPCCGCVVFVLCLCCDCVVFVRCLCRVCIMGGVLMLLFFVCDRVCVGVGVGVLVCVFVCV